MLATATQCDHAQRRAVVPKLTPCYLLADTSATLAVQTPSEGYVAFAFAGDNPSQMPGATAVIATTDSANSQAGVYSLNSRDVSGVVEVPDAVTLTTAGRRLSQAAVNVYDVRRLLAPLPCARNAIFAPACADMGSSAHISACFVFLPCDVLHAVKCCMLVQVEVERSGGSTLLKFTRDFDDTFDGASQVDALVAHRSDPSLGVHDGREAVGFALSADGGVVNIVDPVEKHRRTHAILMILGWGLLLPLGVIIANTLRTLGPIWCAFAVQLSPAMQMHVNIACAFVRAWGADILPHPCQPHMPQTVSPPSRV